MGNRNEKLYAYYDQQLKDIVGKPFEVTQMALKETCKKFNVKMPTLLRLLDKRERR